MSRMTPEAKNRLSSTIVMLRERLIEDFHNAADSTYRLSIPIEKSGLSEENRTKRERLEAWLDEQARMQSREKKETFEKARERHYRTVVKLAAATFLNRIVVIRHMEAIGLLKPAVVTGGWQSSGYREFREFAPDLLNDQTEGYATLLELVFAELALDLPGLFGEVSVTGLFPIQATTLRTVIDALEDPMLKSAWEDDTTLGWVYQFWNDPERIALDDKVKNRGKIENHEIAAKTQLFTDRYMVEWLLQNSLNNFWLAICQKNGWIPEVRANGTLDSLKNRRQEWRNLREEGKVTLEEMMPIETEQEQRWKYWVDQVLSDEFITAAPVSIGELTLLDPAVGSGHFLVIAFDMLTHFYKEEARHRGETWPENEIAESIVENNLHGIDLDPRAVQIAAAALLLKARSFGGYVTPHHMNLVASNLGLATLPDDDPAIKLLVKEVQLTTGIPQELTMKIIHSLKGADYLGSLLKIDETVEAAIREHEAREQNTSGPWAQGDLFKGFPAQQTVLPFEEAKVTLLDKLNIFLGKCTSATDLGLRLRGKQLAAGVRFIHLLKQDRYNLVIANPPYHSSGKLASPELLKKLYPLGGQDLFSAFIIKTSALAKPHGLSATVTLSNWLYIGMYENLREYVIDNVFIKMIADLGKAAFSSGSMLINCSLNILQKSINQQIKSVAIRPFAPEEVIVDPRQVIRNEAALMLCGKKFEFDVHKLKEVIQGHPLIYWWDDDLLKWYQEAPKLGEISPAKFGLNTGNNDRFLRLFWEQMRSNIAASKIGNGFTIDPQKKWYPCIKGAAGRNWIEGLKHLILWHNRGVEIRIYSKQRIGCVIRNYNFYFKPGVAFSMIGKNFSSRIHRYYSVITDMGSSIYNIDGKNVTCFLNSNLTKYIMSSLNPTIHFQVGDVNRMPIINHANSHFIFDKVENSFAKHERTNELSIEFLEPGFSSWSYTEKWAQQAVDRPEGAPLPPYEPVYDEPPPTDYLSFAVGIALSRFGSNGEGILDTAPDTALPHGILYLSNHADRDSLDQPTCQMIKEYWSQYGPDIAPKSSLKALLMSSFFKDVHVKMYENRPIYFPLSSKNKNFVAFISIHRWQDDTLQVLLADYLLPEQKQMEGELQDLLETRQQGDHAAQADAETRYSNIRKYHDELFEFISLVAQCAEQGPPPANPKDTPRETDARYVMDLDDGVMINSSALWPLLEPQWKQPKAWWSELCNAKGRKDYDWAHLAARYFPSRVETKCQEDPSLAVSHCCFWKYHPEKAYQWELRLQDEIAPDFTIDEQDSDDLRAHFENEHQKKVKDLIENEKKRREKKRKQEQKNDKDNNIGPLITDDVWST